MVKPIEISTVYALLETVKDPEVPVLSILDLGVVRDVSLEDKQVHIHLTPTYSGCPAMDTIKWDIITVLTEHGFKATIEFVLSPAWTTDWISEKGRKALREYGIASPLDANKDKRALMGESQLLECPQCKSTNTKLLSAFGSTACKALFQCKDCLEPFDYFKCLS